MAGLNAFVVALVLTLVTTPFVRRLALATDFVDHPTSRKRHRRSIPYLGGIPIMTGALAGLFVGAQLTGQMAVIALAAAALGAVGLIDDDRSLHASVRLGAQAAAAALVLTVGVRVHVTEILVLDVLLTIVWIVGITNALNLLDNMDGLASGVAAAASGGVFVLAAISGQEDIARLAAGTCGASLAFLAYNKRPASIFMGDAGSLFLGFLLSVSVLGVDPALNPPAAYLVPLLLLALPVADTAMVITARLRRGRPITEGGRDHISHRLVARHMGPGTAVLVLVGIELILAVLAVLAGRAVVPLPIVAGIATVLMGGLIASTISSPVYHDPVVGLPRALRLVVGLGLVAVVLMTVAGAVGMLAARRPARAGVDLALAGLSHATNGEYDAAATAFASAGEEFEQARSRMNWSFSAIALPLPVVGTNVRSARTLLAVGEELSETGRRLNGDLNPSRLKLTDGKVPLAELARMTPGLERAADQLESALSRVRSANRPYLASPLEQAVKDFDRRVAPATIAARSVATAAELAPAMFGADGPRRYFLAIQNSAELRATGGFMGSFGEVEAVDGAVKLTRIGRISELRDAVPVAAVDRTFTAPSDFMRRFNSRLEGVRQWTHVNISPDLPTVANIIRQLYPQSGGRPIDGVIALDPVGIAAMLRVTGPVSVEGWPEPVTTDNVVDISLRDQYTRFPDRAVREDFLADVTEVMWQRLTSGDIGDPAALVRALGVATGERHLQVALFPKREARFVRDLGISGRTPPVPSDSLLVVNHNAAGNKLDYYMSRHVKYRAEIEPVGSAANVLARLEVSLDSDAPTSGLSSGVIGPYDTRFKPGQNVTELSVYTPLRLDGVAWNQRPVRMGTTPELGRVVHSAYLSLLGDYTGSLGLNLSGRVRLEEGGWYTLDLVRQATLHPDAVELEVEVPEGWRIAETTGPIASDGQRRASSSFDLLTDTTVGVRLERIGWRGRWDRFVGRW